VFAKTAADKRGGIKRIKGAAGKWHRKKKGAQRGGSLLLNRKDRTGHRENHLLSRKINTGYTESPTQGNTLKGKRTSGSWAE